MALFFCYSIIFRCLFSIDDFRSRFTASTLPLAAPAAVPVTHQCADAVSPCRELQSLADQERISPAAIKKTTLDKVLQQPGVSVSGVANGNGRSGLSLFNSGIKKKNWEQETCEHITVGRPHSQRSRNWPGTEVQDPAYWWHHQLTCLLLRRGVMVTIREVSQQPQCWIVRLSQCSEGCWEMQPFVSVVGSFNTKMYSFIFPFKPRMNVCLLQR